MTKDEMNTYKWLDAQEVKPQVPAEKRMLSAERSFQRKMSQKMLELIDQL